MTNYHTFIKNKIRLDSRMGFEVGPGDIHPALKSHQRDIVVWALSGGRRAIFAAFGLGKTVMQIESMRQIGRREGGRQLIVAPLGVRQEFRRDAAAIFGLDISFIACNAGFIMELSR